MLPSPSIHLLISSARVLAGPSFPSAIDVAPTFPDGLDGDAGREAAATESDASPLHHLSFQHLVADQF